MLDTIITQTGQAEPFAPATIQKAGACRTITSDKPQHSNTAILPPGNKFSNTLRAGARNTQQTADSRPDRAALSRPKFAAAGFPASHGCGLDGQSGNAWRTSVCVFRTSSPPAARRKVASGFQQFKQELETMPQAITPLVRPSAPAIASNDANTPTTTDAVRLHLLAVNGLAEALHVLRHGDLSPEAMHRAIGRAIRGTTALKRLAAMEGVAA